MKNKDKYNLRELLFSRECDFSYILYNGKYIAKFNGMNTYEYFSTVIDWLEEEYQEPPILDEKEKEYLKAVVRPWRDKIVFIYKFQNYLGERIGMSLKGNDTSIFFPFFEKGAMYAGMELERPYTLEELGI